MCPPVSEQWKTLLRRTKLPLRLLRLTCGENSHKRVIITSFISLSDSNTAAKQHSLITQQKQTSRIQQIAHLKQTANQRKNLNLLSDQIQGFRRETHVTLSEFSHYVLWFALHFQQTCDFYCLIKWVVWAFACLARQMNTEMTCSHHQMLSEILKASYVREKMNQKLLFQRYHLRNYNHYQTDILKSVCLEREQMFYKSNKWMLTCIFIYSCLLIY